MSYNCLIKTHSLQRALLLVMILPMPQSETSLVQMLLTSSLVLVLHGHLLHSTGPVMKQVPVVFQLKREPLPSQLLSSVLKPFLQLPYCSSVAVMVVNWEVQEVLKSPHPFSLFSFGSSTSLCQLQRLTASCKSSPCQPNHAMNRVQANRIMY